MLPWNNQQGGEIPSHKNVIYGDNQLLSFIIVRNVAPHYSQPNANGQAIKNGSYVGKNLCYGH